MSIIMSKRYYSLVGPRSRNENEKQARREAILDAAEQAFLQERFHKTPMGAIAKSAGLSRALLYVYFKDKEDIHSALCSRASATLFQRMSDYSATASTGLDKIKQIGRAYLDFYLKDTNHFRILTLSSGLASTENQSEAILTPSKQELSEKECNVMNLMCSCVQKGLDDGTIKINTNLDPMGMAMYLRGSLHGLIMLQDKGASYIFEKENIDRDQWLLNSLNLITQSIACD